MFGMTTKDLSVRSDRVTFRGARDAGWKTVLHSEGETDAWRIIEASSADGRPFELELYWTAANGAGANAKVTVAHATRICVFCRTVRVRSKNLDAKRNDIGVTIADGYAETRNQYEVRGDALIDETSEMDDNPLKFRIPPFARRFHISTTDPDNSGHVITRDGLGRRRSHTYLSKQPDQGIPVGGACEIEMWVGPYDFRIVFELEV